jgi:hypothetical protein
MYKSTDGMSWTETHNNVNDGSMYYTMIVHDGIFMVETDNHIITSSDGENWTYNSIPYGDNFALKSLCVANDLVFCVMHSNSTGYDTHYYSEGGINPTFTATGLSRASGGSTTMRTAYNGSMYCVMRGYSQTWTSPDLETWTYNSTLSGLYSSSIGSMVGGNGTFVIGTFNTSQYYTEDGVNFNYISIGNAMNEQYAAYPLFDGERFIAIGAYVHDSIYDGRIWTSADGITWSMEANTVDLSGYRDTMVLLDATSLAAFEMVGSLRSVAFGSFAPPVEEPSSINCVANTSSIITSNKVRAETIGALILINSPMRDYKVRTEAVGIVCKPSNTRTHKKTEELLTTLSQQSLNVTETTKHFTMTEV